MDTTSWVWGAIINLMGEDQGSKLITGLNVILGIIIGVAAAGFIIQLLMWFVKKQHIEEEENPKHNKKMMRNLGGFLGVCSTFFIVTMIFNFAGTYVVPDDVKTESIIMIIQTLW